MRGRPGSVTEISVFPTGISVSGLEILPYEHFIPVTARKIKQCIFVDRADITEVLILFSSIMKLEIVLFDI